MEPQLASGVVGRDAAEFLTQAFDQFFALTELPEQRANLEPHHWNGVERSLSLVARDQADEVVPEIAVADYLREHAVVNGPIARRVSLPARDVSASSTELAQVEVLVRRLLSETGDHICCEERDRTIVISTQPLRYSVPLQPAVARCHEAVSRFLLERDRVPMREHHTRTTQRFVVGA